MPRFAAFVAAASLFTVGCATTRFATPVTPEVVNHIREFDTPTIHVELVTPLPAGDPEAPDEELTLERTTETTTYVHVGSSSAVIALPNAAVGKLRVRNRGRGAGVGAGIGALVGAATLGWIAASYRGDDQEFFDRDLQLIIGTAYVVVPAILLGTLTGWIIGTTDTYAFE